jgi:hypothetical protein
MTKKKNWFLLPFFFSKVGNRFPNPVWSGAGAPPRKTPGGPVPGGPPRSTGKLTGPGPVPVPGLLFQPGPGPRSPIPISRGHRVPYLPQKGDWIFFFPSEGLLSLHCSVGSLAESTLNTLIKIYVCKYKAF